jgi:hypothetical protein
MPDPGTPTPTTNTTAVEVRLGDGSIVKGATMDEAFANLSKMKVDTNAALMESRESLRLEKEEKERLAQEKTALEEQLRAAKEPPKPAPQTDGKGFNRDTYFAMLGEDPMKAQDYVDSFRFGIESPDKVRDTFNTMRQTIDNVSQRVDGFTQQSVTAAFLAQHPDYPQGDPEAAKILTNRVAELTQAGFPYNPDTIEFAYMQMVGQEKIKPLELTQDDQQQATPQDAPNPSLTGAGAGVLDTEAQKAEQMSDADLLKLLQSKGMFR